MRELRKRGGTLPVPVVVHVTRAVLRALQAAHRLHIKHQHVGVVHGDIKPGNVLVSSHGEVVVTDFGIARFVPDMAIISRPMGTLRYMAPEQYDGRICPQNDLYSVGVMLHELLTGRALTQGCRTEEDYRRWIREGKLPELDVEAPAALDRLRRGLLEIRVEDRIRTADEALSLLSAAGRADVQEELAGIYTRTIGPPHSGLTKYLQDVDEDIGSFLPELVQRRAARKREPREPAPPTIEPGTPKPDPDAPTAASSAEVSSPWMLDDAQPEGPSETVLLGEPPSQRRLDRTAPAPAPVVDTPRPRGSTQPFVPSAPPRMPEPARLVSPTPGDAPSVITGLDGFAVVEQTAPAITETTPTRHERRTVRRLAIAGTVVGVLAVGVVAFVARPTPGPHRTPSVEPVAHASRVDEEPAAPLEIGPPPPDDQQLAPPLEIGPPPSDGQQPAPPLDIESPPTDAAVVDEPIAAEPEPPELAVASAPGSGNPPPTPKAADDPDPDPPPAKTKTRPPKVTVLLFPGKTGANQIRVDRKVYDVDWIVKAKLRPGKYPLSWRTNEADPWHSAGVLKVDTLPPDQLYEVRLESGRHVALRHGKRGGR